MTGHSQERGSAETSSVMASTPKFTGDTPAPDEEGPGAIAKELNLELKPRRRKVKDKSAGVHDIVFSVAIAVAVPLSASSDDSQSHTNMTGTQMAGDSGRGIPNYYHLEFKLFPDDKDPVKLDLVIYGNSAAKIYPNQGEQKPVIKIWSSGDELWVCWQHNFQTTVNTELLQMISEYRFEVRIWDSKDKCSTKTRWDKPKIRLPQVKPGQDPEDVGGVKGSVLRLSTSYEKYNTVTVGELAIPLPHVSVARQLSLQSERFRQLAAGGLSGSREHLSTGDRRSRGKRGRQKEDYSLFALPRQDRGGTQRSFTRLQRLAGAGSPDADESHRRSAGKRSAVSGVPHLEEISERASTTMRSGMETDTGMLTAVGDHPEGSLAAGVAAGGVSAFGVSGAVASSADVRRHRKNKMQDAEYLRWEKDGRACLSVNMGTLFARHQVLDRLRAPVENIEDMFIQVSINEPLLSDEQKSLLNPMVIKVRSACGMPSTPLSYDCLRQLAEPVYCQYQFMGEEIHRTSGQTHGNKITWDDYKVVLTGLLDQKAFYEYLSGPGLSIEVHDRDSKVVEEQSKAALFGDDLEDEKISNIGTVTSKRTVHNVYEERLKPWDPYATARCDLSELLAGQRIVVLRCPLAGCPPPDVLGLVADSNRRIPGVAGAVDGPQGPSLPAGHYIDSGAAVKVIFEMSRPLKMTASTAFSPFGRIVFMFEYRNIVALHRLQGMIRRINAAALGLADVEDHVISTALTTHKLKPEDKSDPNLNVLTGFHIMDGVRHLCVLEGVRTQAIESLWSTLEKEHPEDDFHVLYNADMGFNCRLYADMGLDIAGIKLHDTVESIVAQPLLYVRDMLPKPCFQAITRLMELLHCPTLQVAVKSDLLPTPEMLTSMSKELSVPLTINDMYDMDSTVAHSASSSALQRQQQQTPSATSHKDLWSFQYRRVRTAIDNQNDDYVRLMRERSMQTFHTNFVAENRSTVARQSAVVRDERAKSSPMVMVTVNSAPAHNYSTQRLNTTEMARSQIREYLNSGRNYTYMPEFHNAGGVTPVDPELVKKKTQEERRRRWKTTGGWRYPGWKSSAEANHHPQALDPARADDLQEPWEENLNHKAELCPTLSGRGPYTWQSRNNDFKVWDRPRGPFKKEPLTIHSTGVAKMDERLAEMAKDMEQWEQRVVVDNTQFHSHRVLPASEACPKGIKASNQIDKQGGLLKDRPGKYGLLYPGIQEMPSLCVIHGGKTEDDVFGVSFMPGPEPPNTSLIRNNLRRPEHGRGFNLYHKERSRLAKTPHRKLTVSERDTHLFEQSSQPTLVRIDPQNDSQNESINQLTHHNVPVECS